MTSTETLKEQFAASTAEAFRLVFPELHKTVGESGPFNSQELLGSIEKPRDPKMGRFALPIFRYLPQLKSNPGEVTAKVSAATNKIIATNYHLSPLRSLGVGPYLNASVDPTVLAQSTLSQVLASGQQYADSTEGSGKTILVEYSSPNIAKPFGVGHLRSTVIGNSLRQIFRKLGYAVVGINFPGDWGTQFGKMIVAYQRWGNEQTLRQDPVKNLLELYVRFHEEAEKDDAMNQAARDAFKQLEDGDPSAVALWEQFKKFSFEEFDRIYGILGVEFDLVYGESFLNDKMDGVVERLAQDGLTSISKGALVVDLKDPLLPPALLKKADGATLYITRDIAGLIYRWGRYHFSECLYVVGSSQADHFKQVFKVLAMMEEAELVPADQRMSSRAKHIDFGWIKFGDKTMSTRRGNIIFLEDVIDQAVALVKEKIREKNPDLKTIDATSKMIGVGAVIFSQLSIRRQKDVNFVWEEVLNFEGETGPYLQYTHARLSSLERNYGHPISPEVDFSLLTQDEEQRVIELLADFSENIQDAARNYDPVHIANYLLRLSAAFNKVYQRKDGAGRIDKIISENGRLSAARMTLVHAVRVVIKEGLGLLGLRAPEEM